MSQTEQVEAPVLDVAALAVHRTVRVNLLPKEIEQGRRLRRTQVALAGGLILVVAAAAGVYALQVKDRQDAATDLAVVKAEGTKLQAEQEKYADVPRTIGAIDAAEAARQTALTNDVEWYRTMTNLSLTTPSNVWLTNLTLTVGSGPDGSAPTTAAPSGGATGGTTGGSTSGATTATSGTTTTSGTTAGSATAAGVGTVSVEGYAIDHSDVATWLDTLGKQPGMTGAYFTTSEDETLGTDKVVVKYQSTAVVTTKALSHRYDRKQG
jgi:Tfp pilus assembly protein PilN